MKKKFEIIESRLYAKADYTRMLEHKTLGGFSLSYDELESLPVPTGAICLFDAYNHGKVRPFLQTFPAGECVPFYLCVSTSLGKRIAFAGLRFEERQAVEWKLALFEEKDVIKLASKDNSVTSFVDSGIICFGDFSFVKGFESLVREHAEHDSHPLDSVLDFDGFAALVYDVGDGSKLSVFSSGWGEGNYSGYIGLDADGKPVSLLIDFGMIEYRRRETSAKTVSYEFEIDIEELYQNDPRLTVDENNVARWTLVLENKDEIDDFTLYKAYSRRGYALHNLGRYEAALSDYYAALEIAEDTTRSKNFKTREWTLYDNAGTINKKLGRTEEAIRLFEKAKNIGDSFYSGAYVNLIDIYADEKNYEKALEICSEMVRDRPLDPTSFMRRAEIYVATGNYAAAVGDYDVLIKKFMWEDGIWEKVACLLMLERFSEAEKSLDEYLAENAPNELYYYNLGVLEYKRHNYRASYDNLLRSYDCNPEYIPTLHLLIELDEMLLNFESVVIWASKYIECRPNGSYGYHVRAEENLRLGNYAAVVSDREYIISNFSDDTLNYRSIVCAHIMFGEFAKAMRVLKIMKKKDSAAYADAMGLYCMAKGNYVKGLRILSAAVEAEETETYCADLIDAYIYLGKTEWAERLINRLELLAPSSERLIFSKVSLCLKYGGDGFENIVKEYVAKFVPGLDDEEYMQRIRSGLSGFRLSASAQETK